VKGALQISYGYRLIRMNGKVYFFTKLVAMTWSYNENPDENTMVDHIMGSQTQDLKDNYCVENMRWVSPSQNQLAIRGQHAGDYELQVYDEEMKLFSTNSIRNHNGSTQ
jgi:hypothetical protein